MRKNVTYYAESYKTAFLVALFLVCAVAIHRWFVVPHQNYLAAAQKYESAIRTLDEKRKVISNNLKANRIKNKKLQEKLDILQEKLFNPLEEREFFSSVEDVCRKTDCKMLLLTFSQSSASGSKHERDLPKDEYVTASAAHLVVEGRYGNIIVLMNKLQDGTRLVKIDPVNIDSGSNPGFLKCDMTVTIYVTNEEKDLQNVQYK